MLLALALQLYTRGRRQEASGQAQHPLHKQAVQRNPSGLKVCESIN